MITKQFVKIHRS